MRKFLLFLTIGPFSCYAQLSEDFSADLSLWQQDSSYFNVYNGELRSNGPAEISNICISTTSTAFSASQWEFYVRMEFSPSASNYAKVYLAADSPDFTEAVNGFYVKIGGEAGNTDGIDLYRQTGNTHTKIIDGIAGHAAKDLNTLRIKVTRSANGNWSMYSDTLGGYNYTEEGQALDGQEISSTAFGIVCIHTSTRSDKFYFDDIRISSLPAALTGAHILDSMHIKIYFSGDVEENSAAEPFNYTLPEEISISGITINYPGQFMLIQLSAPLLQGNHLISISGIKDTEGNLIPPAQFTVPFYTYGGVIITEVMADPSPPVGLPETEYVEIFNPLSTSIQLQDFSLSDPSVTGILPQYDLQPGDFLVLCPPGTKTLFSPSVKAVEVSPFPSLNNAGDIITISDPSGSAIFSVEYSDNWYGNSLKKDGGYSLELADLQAYCKGFDSWTASESSTGGTPGKANSVSFTPDQESPSVVSVNVLNNNAGLIIITSEETTESSLPGLHIPGIKIDKAEKAAADTVIIFLKDTLEVNKFYTLRYAGLADCIGNSAEADAEISFIVPAQADSTDILLSEILFNPYPYGVDFIELYNASGSYVDLKAWSLSNGSTSFNISNSIIIPPSGFKVFTTDISNILTHYPKAREDNLIQVSALPAWPDDEGIVILKNPEGDSIQIFGYHKSYHHPLLEKQDGVSLERLSYIIAVNDPHNWHSASASAEYATPGYENSQAADPVEDGFFAAEPKVISPNGDGWNDFTFLNYHLKKEGYIGSMSVYDFKGRLVRRICSNEIFGKEGTLKWDGTNESNQRAPTGYYLVFMEMFNMDGDSLRLKTSIAIANQD